METAQRVVVIQDASKEVSSVAIRRALHGLSLKPGDVLTLVGILHQVNNPSTLSLMKVGCKSRVDLHSIIGANQRIVALEKARKKEEYENNVELVQISKMYEMQKVELKIEVGSGPSPRAIALELAEKLKATWVILDRYAKDRSRKAGSFPTICGTKLIDEFGSDTAKINHHSIHKLSIVETMIVYVFQKLSKSAIDSPLACVQETNH